MCNWCFVGCTCIYTYMYNYIVDEAHGERSKESIRGKCTQYLERTEQVKKYFQKKNKRVQSSGGTPAEFTSTSTGGNPPSPHSSPSLTASKVTSAFSVRALVVVSKESCVNTLTSLVSQRWSRKLYKTGLHFSTVTC